MTSQVSRTLVVLAVGRKPADIPGERRRELRILRSKKKWIVLGILVIAASVGVGVAVATVTSTILVDTTSVRLRIDRSEFVPSADQPGFSSGWHTDPGPVIIQV